MRVNPYGDKEWKINGHIYHREDGPAVIREDGTQYWCVNNHLHREDGPAVIEADGTQEWFINGIRHREDGPAILNNNDKYREWYLNGNNITKEVKSWMKSKGYRWNKTQRGWPKERVSEFLLMFS